MIVQGDTIRLPFADGAFDLVFGSPPYQDARTYGISAQRGCQEWVDWMLEITQESLRVCRGAVIWVCAGVTRDRNYQPGPEGLAYEWWKRGGSMYRPCYWGAPARTPGSGGDQWFRADVEYVMCFKREGPLPWTDNTAMGHAPKYGPGGDMSNRKANGFRVNQWGTNGVPARRADGVRAIEKNYKRKCGVSRRPSGVSKKMEAGHIASGGYDMPDIANPGNLIMTSVGGRLIGDRLAHQNEAPFPEKLAEWFIRSLAPEGGRVLDPFGGSGTTKAVADRWGRIGVSLDIRMSQCKLMKRRCQPYLVA